MNVATLQRLTRFAPLLLAAAFTSCARLDTNSQVDVRPIEVKPIHITVDVNVRIDRQLDQFFAFEEQVDPNKPSTTSTTTAPTTRPATTTVNPTGNPL
jgi:hypothetical protein